MQQQSVKVILIINQRIIPYCETYISQVYNTKEWEDHFVEWFDVVSKTKNPPKEEDRYPIHDGAMIVDEHFDKVENIDYLECFSLYRDEELVWVMPDLIIHAGSFEKVGDFITIATGEISCEYLTEENKEFMKRFDPKNITRVCDNNYDFNMDWTAK